MLSHLIQIICLHVLNFQAESQGEKSELRVTPVRTFRQSVTTRRLRPGWTFTGWHHVTRVCPGGRKHLAASTCCADNSALHNCESVKLGVTACFTSFGCFLTSAGLQDDHVGLIQIPRDNSV